MTRPGSLLLLALTAGGWAGASEAAEISDRLASLQLPPGFEIEVFAEVPQAREIEVAPDGRTVIVSTRGDELFVVSDRDGDFRAETVRPLSTDLEAPHGIALSADGRVLYVAERNRILGIAEWNRNDSDEPDADILFEGLPDDARHGRRSAALGPDGRLYVSVGTPCNICRPIGLAGTILRLETDGSGLEVYARGIRNSVGFDWHPDSGELYFTDNGGDRLGDLIPPEEVNRAPKAGLHFGYPFVWGSQGHRYPGFEMEPAPDPMEGPAIELDAHAAPLGLHFYRGAMFPQEYRGSALVALHGSWNRDPNDPAGFRVVRVGFDPASNPIAAETFIEGFLADDKRAWGRPVHFAELPDGSLLLSDDHAGVVYRISYGN